MVGQEYTRMGAFFLAELLLPVLFIIIIWRMAAWVVRLIAKGAALDCFT